jgi:AcrR family transcriptional regulator
MIKTKKQIGDGGRSIRQKERTREKLRQIASKSAKLFIKKGYAESSIREIARVTGINSGNLYNFIENKEDILRLVFNMFHSPQGNAFDKYGIYDIKDPEEQLRAAVRKSIEIVNQYSNEILLMYRESKALPKSAMKIVMQRERDFINFFEEVIKKGVKKKVFDVKNPFYAANMIVYQISIFPLRGWNLKEKFTNEELIDLTEKYILKAILPK